MSIRYTFMIKDILYQWDRKTEPFRHSRYRENGKGKSHFPFLQRPVDDPFRIHCMIKTPFWSSSHWRTVAMVLTQNWTVSDRTLSCCRLIPNNNRVTSDHQLISHEAVTLDLSRIMELHMVTMQQPHLFFCPVRLGSFHARNQYNQITFPHLWRIRGSLFHTSRYHLGMKIDRSKNREPGCQWLHKTTVQFSIAK